jgi:23S rRNA (uracil1939-C5)-methyltransferase
MPSLEDKRLKIGDQESFLVQDLVPKGFGLSDWNGKPVQIKQALPGERVRARVTRIRRTHIEASCESIEVSSPDRITPRCGHFGPCGGCDLQHLSSPAQLDWKLNSLRKTLQGEGISNLPEIQTVSMEEPWGYRNKMELTFSQEADQIICGFHQRGNFQRIVDVNRCHIAPDGTDDLLEAIKETVNQLPPKAYNPRTHEGFWRFAIIRSSVQTGQLLLLLVTHGGSAEPLEVMRRELFKKVPKLKSLFWGVSTSISDVATCERMTCLEGPEMLEDQIGPIRFELGPTTFVQPNFRMAVQAYEAIKDAAQLSGEEVVYDLYSGIGLIALSLADKAKMVYGVESEEQNVQFAQKNAQRNGIKNAMFICGKVEDLLKHQTLFKKGLPADLIVVDPPRAGLHKNVIGPLLQAQSPTLAYLSCNPVSLVRDLKFLLDPDSGYRIQGIRLFDFFPQTGHTETLVTLQRR